MKLTIDKASKKIGETTILDHVSLQLSGGHCYGFQGINGSGKTMLMRLISGLIFPTEGEIHIDGRKSDRKHPFPDSMGLLIENPSFLDRYSGLKNLEMLASINGHITHAQVAKAISRVGLDPQDSKKFKKYSLGMKQRLGIACAIMEKPDLIILDEPFNSLDEQGIEDLRAIIHEEKKRGALVVISCHDKDLLTAAADEIFHITAGRITKHSVKASDGVFVEEQL